MRGRRAEPSARRILPRARSAEAPTRRGAPTSKTATLAMPRPSPVLRSTRLPVSPAGARRLLVGAVVLVLATLVVVFGAHHYPVPHSDSAVFLPTAVNLAAGHGMVNPSYYVYPAPLYAWVLSALMPSATPSGAILAAAALAALNLGLAGAAFWGAASAGGRPVGWVQTSWIVLGLGAAALRFSDGAYRPELLVATWLLLGLVYARYGGASRHGGVGVTVYGLLLGLMAATNPNAAATAALFVALGLGAVYRPAGALTRLAAIAGVSVVAFGGVLAASPLPLAEAVRSMFSIGAPLVAPSADALAPQHYSLAEYYLLRSSVSFQGLIVLLGAAAAAVVARRRGVASPLLVAAGIVVGAAFLYVTGIRTPNRSYNVLAFVPLAVAAIVYAAPLVRAWQKPARRAALVAGTLVLGAGSLGWVLNAALFPDYLHHGRSLEAARADLAAEGLLSVPSARLNVTSTLWPLTAHYDRVHFCLKLNQCDFQGDWLLVAQHGRPPGPPPARLGAFGLVRDRFVDRPAHVLGVPLAKSPPGFGFAVYHREGAPDVRPDARPEARHP